MTHWTLIENIMCWTGRDKELAEQRGISLVACRRHRVYLKKKYKSKTEMIQNEHC